ncbi:tyrosine-type recombinase/integrase [Clostridium sp. MB40-C1]|uniref:site-specific tyrosine recombinase/integron integrase n=1 Tax=Clostridium sp. MB40-C1 TaxID=3070996 RepID=UPI0027E05362|nr:site-specific tyrosine recombinase/integron integrase [Clostridium sp. MB40-C1]WMJ81952.1 tyrosine-type recombinase/integrase [Clostridium sp. MB40-C1]
MYSTNSKDEVVIKIIGKLSTEFPDIDQLKARNVVEEVLYKYDVKPTETALVASDIEEKLAIYLASKKLDGLSPQTLKNYQYNLLKFAEYLRKPLAAINTMDLRMFLAKRCKGLKPTSVNGQISILKSFFGWLHMEEYIPKNPTLKLKQTKEPKRLRKPLTEEEVELLREACKTPRELCIVELLISTGCRLSEIVGINKEDINWHEMTLCVIGKGNKEREVCFSTKAKILLRKYLLTRKDTNSALFVTSKRPHNRLGRRSVQREIQRIAKRAGFDKSVFPHLFRHSFATHRLNAGMPLHIVQHLLGHESPSTTEIYAQVSKESIMHEYKKIS